MSDTRDPRAADTIGISPDGSPAETIAGDRAASTVGVDGPSLVPTHDVNPAEPDRAGGETIVAPSPSVDKTLDMPSSVGSKKARGSNTTDAGSGVMDGFADATVNTEADEAIATSGLAHGRGSRRVGPAVPGYEIISLEFVAGGSLAQFIGGKPQSPRSAATMVMTPTSTRSAPIPGSSPCSMSYGRRGREARSSPIDSQWRVRGRSHEVCNKS
jgi:hypothetical protein